MKVGTLLMTVILALLKIIWFPMIPWWLVFLPIGFSVILLIVAIFIAFIGAILSEFR